MNIFLSHARKDSELARELAKRLTRGDIHVWNRDIEIEPGENWAKKTGKALDNADFIVFLLTPGSLDSDTVRNDVDFAVMSMKFEHRVFSVIIDSDPAAETEVPWILLKLPHRRVGSPRTFGEVAKEIRELCASGAHA